jgi:hypothetical protein
MIIMFKYLHLLCYTDKIYVVESARGAESCVSGSGKPQDGRGVFTCIPLPALSDG